MFNRNNGSIAIDKKLAFCELTKKLPIKEHDSIKEKLIEWDEHLKSCEPSVTTGALNNCHGDWYEWLLGISSWNTRLRKNGTKHCMLMPNISRFDVHSLYSDNIFEIISDLKAKVEHSGNVNFVTSNPDMVIIDTQESPTHNNGEIVLNSVTESDLERIETCYQNYVGTVSFSNLIGYVSVKTSFRPDRRLQIAHEGSLMKAIHAHIVTRKWLINQTNLKYYAVSTSLTPADRNALNTIATHSLITVTQAPIPAVDEACKIDSISESNEFFDRVL